MTVKDLIAYLQSLDLDDATVYVCSTDRYDGGSGPLKGFEFWGPPGQRTTVVLIDEESDEKP